MKRFRVTLTMLADATLKDVSEYVEEAVQVHGGSFPPEHPFFGRNKMITAVHSELVKDHPKPTEKSINALHIKLGAVVHDVEDRPWVYIGHRVTSVGSHHHYFMKAIPAPGWHYTNGSYGAVKLETLMKKFPDLLEHEVKETT